MRNDKRKNRNKYRAISCVVFVIFIIFMIIFILIDKYYSLKGLDEIMLGIFGSIFAAIFAFAISMLMAHSDDEKSNSYYDDLRHKIIFYDKENSKVEIEDIHHKDKVNYFVTTSQANNRDIIELMIANMKEINEYYVLSKRMTRQSFILAVCMCIGGFMIISVSVAFILINNLEAKEAIIPVISGAVIEAIAATTLIVYKKSLEQLNRYYDALHNNEIFLSSVNLVSKISTDRRDQMYEYIIKTKLEDKPKQNNTEGQ